MVKVLVVCHDRYLSGANRALLDWLESRNRNEIEVTVLLPRCDKETRRRFENLDCTVWSSLYTVPTKKLYKQSFVEHVKDAIKLAWSILVNPFLSRFFAKKALSKKIQIVHSNTFATTFGAAIANSMHVPHVWHVREFCEIDHGFTHYWPYMLKRHCKLSHAVFISDIIARYYLQKYEFKSSRVIYDKVSFDIDVHKKRTFMSDGFCNIIIVGAISEGKGQLEAIEAINEVRRDGYNVKLYICGQGNRNQIKRLISDSTEYIFDLGYRDDINQIRTNMDIALVCSRMEAFGRVTVEAQYYQNVVIGADAGCTSDIIHDGKTGFLYRLGDYKDLAKKIEYCINNPQVVKTISENAFHTAVKLYSHDISLSLLDLYNSLICNS